MKNSIIYANIDPSPVDNRVEKQIEVLNKYFGKVVSNITVYPSFPKAVKWCWESIDSSEQFTFGLQQDWELRQKINIEDLKPNKNHSTTIRAYMNGDKFYLMPSLRKTSFLKELAKKMKYEINPEVQARELTLNDNGFRQYPNKVVMFDIGRNYLKDNNITRNSNSSKFFTTHKLNSDDNIVGQLKRNSK